VNALVRPGVHPSAIIRIDESLKARDRNPRCRISCYRVQCGHGTCPASRSSSTKSVSDALRDMQSKDLRKREASFEELMTHVASEGSLTEFFDRHPDQAEPVKLGLIQLLVKEDGTFIASAEQVPQPSYTEADGGTTPR